MTVTAAAIAYVKARNADGAGWEGWSDIDMQEAFDAGRASAWEPTFDANGVAQERLLQEFCTEIANSCAPDPVRLLEMAEALYRAEREEDGPE